MKEHRTERIGRIVQRVVASALQEALRTDTPTISRVSVAPDLRSAVVWILSPRVDETEVLNKLNDLKPQIQKKLGAQLESKFTPRLNFRIDEAKKRANRIDDLLDSI